MKFLRWTSISPGSFPKNGILLPNAKNAPTATRTTPNKIKLFPNSCIFKFNLFRTFLKYPDFTGGLAVFLRACSARSGQGCQAGKSVGQSAGTNQSEVAPRRGATSAPEKHCQDRPRKICLLYFKKVPAVFLWV